MLKRITFLLMVIIALVTIGTSTYAEENQPTSEQETIVTASSISWWWE